MTHTRHEQIVQKNLQGLPRTYTTTTLSAKKRRRAVKNGSLKVLLPGRYALATVVPDQNDEFHVKVDGFRSLRLSAGLTKLQPDEVVSHHSAGLLWGLPTMGGDIRVHVIRPHQGRTQRTGFALHRQRLDPDQVLGVHGFRITSLEQTAIDLAVCLPKHEGLAIIDAARRIGARLPVLRKLARARVGNGRVKVQRLLELSVDNAESPYESIIRYWLHQAGATTAVTQLWIDTLLGPFRVDTAVPEIKLVVEFDGKEKYGKDRGSVIKEKRRQDALRAAGWEVKHYMSEDLANPERLIAHFRALLRQLGYQCEHAASA